MHNFQDGQTIERIPVKRGIRGVLGAYPGLRDAMVVLIAARHDLVHTSVPVRFNMRASYYAVVGLAFGLARHLPELEADMRLAGGDTFHGMRMPGRSREGYEKAEPLCRAPALKRPESAQAHARLGLALAGLGRHGGGGCALLMDRLDAEGAKRPPPRLHKGVHYFWDHTEPRKT